MRLSRELRSAIEEIVSGRSVPNGVTTQAFAALDSRVGVLALEKKKLEARVSDLEQGLTLAKESATKESLRAGALEAAVTELKGLYTSLAKRSEEVDERVEDRLEEISENQKSGLAAITRQLVGGSVVEGGLTPPRPTKPVKPAAKRAKK